LLHEILDVFVDVEIEKKINKTWRNIEPSIKK